jgi:hypothetical protein
MKRLLINLFQWARWDSNPGPKDYEFCVPVPVGCLLSTIELESGRFPLYTIY